MCSATTGATVPNPPRETAAPRLRLCVICFGCYPRSGSLCIKCGKAYDRWHRTADSGDMLGVMAWSARRSRRFEAARAKRKAGETSVEVYNKAFEEGQRSVFDAQCAKGGRR